MAGLFMFLAFPLGLLGFDRGSQSWIPSLPSLPLIPSEFHLGFHLGSYLGSLGFDFETPTRRQRQGLSQHL